MKVAEKDTSTKTGTGKKVTRIITSIVCIIAILVVISAVLLQRIDRHESSQLAAAAMPGVKEQLTVETDPTLRWNYGYVSGLNPAIGYFDEDGNALGTVIRGTRVKYNTDENGKTDILLNDIRGTLQEDARVVSDPADAIPEHTLYVRTAVNLRSADNKLTDVLAEKGSAVTVTGYDYLNELGVPHLYSVTLNGKAGYIDPWYLESDEETALANYDGDGNYAIHADREDHYGGGFGANLDYSPRKKGNFADNVMPEECRTLYLASWCLDNVDAYIDIADQSGINAFVVDITDGSSIGYAADVMKEYSPSAAAAASCTVEEYKAAIDKLKDAGYYVIGRITTFNDSHFIADHPEHAVLDNYGEPMYLHGDYWPSAYSRYAWQYKVDLAVEAVELMGFNEIQFDYVRFPDLTMEYEEAGTIDFQNTYGETKAQAIQRFLMYATDILHEHGAYVSADVYGESAYNYVTAYGQYWPAISNVVDVISGMPYPDHFGWTDDWKPWEHPYETLYDWGESVMTRQSETATPAIVRTWIQAYNAIREPYNTYGSDEVYAQIKGLRDAGCTGGYMTWNSASSVDKYTSLMPAFTAPEDEE